jgi:hypothetical protein
VVYPGKFHYDEWEAPDPTRFRTKKKKRARDDITNDEWRDVALDGAFEESQLFGVDNDTFAWEEKANALFWRGSISGMRIRCFLFCFM